jgi:hypothetical protein
LNIPPLSKFTANKSISITSDCDWAKLTLYKRIDIILNKKIQRIIKETTQYNSTKYTTSEAKR